MELKEHLEQLFNETYSELNESSKDFVGDHSADESSYLSDAFMEFADSNTSIYYSDQRQYFNEHTEECENALLELYDSDSIADYIKKNGLDGLICHAGAVGEYDSIYRELSDNEDEICQCLVIKYIIDNLDTYKECDIELIDEAIEDSTAYRINRIDDLIDNLNDITEVDNDD